MDPRLITLVIVCLISIFCGALVALSVTTASKQKIPFIITITSIVIWLILLYLSNLRTSEYGTALLINRLVYVGPVLAVVAFSEVILNLVPGQNVAQWPRLTLAKRQQSVRLLGLVTLLFAVSPYCVRSVTERSDIYGNFSGYNIHPGALYPLFGLSIVILGVITVMRFTAAAHHSEPRQRNSLMWVLWGLIVTLVVGTVTNIILPILIEGNKILNIIGTISPLFILIALTYTMLWHKLLDVRAAVARTAVYGSVTLILSGLYIAPAIYILAIGIMGFPFVPHKFIIGTIFATFIAIYFERLRNWFDLTTSKIFVRDTYDSAVFLSELNKILVSTIDLNDLLYKSADSIAKTLKAEFCLFSLNETPSADKRLIGTPKKKFPLTDITKIRYYSPKYTSKVITANLLDGDNKELKAIFNHDDVGVLIRLSSSLDSREEGLGHIILGYKRSGNPYNNQDVRLFEAIADVLTIAIQNALRFEEIQNFNTTLQLRVEDRTRQLQKTNEKLKAFSEWTAKSIDERQVMLIDLAKDVWKTSLIEEA